MSIKEEELTCIVKAWMFYNNLKCVFKKYIIKKQYVHDIMFHKSVVYRAV